MDGHRVEHPWAALIRRLDLLVIADGDVADADFVNKFFNDDGSRKTVDQLSKESSLRAARATFDIFENSGDALTFLGIVAAPETGGLSGVVVVAGEVIGGFGLAGNVILDFSEGKNYSALGRLALEGASFGFGKQIEKAFPKANQGEINEKVGKAIADYFNIITKKSIELGTSGELNKGSENNKTTEDENPE